MRRHTRFAGRGCCLTHLTVECRRSQRVSGFAGIAESARGSLTAAASHALRILSTTTTKHRQILTTTVQRQHLATVVKCPSLSPYLTARAGEGFPFQLAEGAAPQAQLPLSGMYRGRACSLIDVTRGTRSYLNT
jgi:hypothetical protein